MGNEERAHVDVGTVEKKTDTTGLGTSARKARSATRSASRFTRKRAVSKAKEAWRKRPLSRRAVPRPRRKHRAPNLATSSGPTLMERAIYRWVAVAVVMTGFFVVYTQHPYLRARCAVHGVSLGLRRCVRALARARPPVRARHAPALLGYALHDARRRAPPRPPRQGAAERALLANREEAAFAHDGARHLRQSIFTPLMFGFFAGHVNSIANAWLAHKHPTPLDFKMPNGLSPLAQVTTWWSQMSVRIGDLVPHAGDFAGLFAPSTWTRADISWGLGLAYDFVFLTDVGCALIGYTCESRWLGNKTRSVEPTPLGWLVALACYPPYNNVTGTYLPLDNGPNVITGANVLLAMRAASVFLFAIYACATVSFGFKFSNLTNRGIVSRGPYRFVRHPAYLCKCLAWWL